MNGTRLTGLIVSILAATWIAMPAGADEDEPCQAPTPPEGTYWEETPTVTRLDAVLPGSLVGYALPRVDGERREILLLVDPEGVDDEAGRVEDDEDDDRMPPCPLETPRRLYRIRPRERDDAILVRDDLPADAGRIDSLDLDGDGRDELLLHRPGELRFLDLSETAHAGGDRQDRVLLEHADLGRPRTHPRVALEPELAGVPLVVTSGTGAFRVHAPAEGSDTWATVAELSVPRLAEVREESILIRDREVEWVGRRSDGHLWFATIPNAVDSQRLEVILFEVSPAGAVRVQECWSRLPGPEHVLEFRYLVRDDLPWLAVLTTASDQVSFFGEKRLRIFPLGRSRSRLGLDPRFAATTRMNLWQLASWHSGDVDGDGRRDLVLGYWKGLTDDRVVLDVYLREETGEYRRSPKTTSFDVKHGDRSFLVYGRDLTGDHLADLLIRSGCDLVLFPGLPSRNGSKLVSRQGAFRVMEQVKPGSSDFSVTVGTGGSEVGASAGGFWEPRFVDLDGDGRDEVLASREGGDGEPGRFRVVWIHANR